MKASVPSTAGQSFDIGEEAIHSHIEFKDMTPDQLREVLDKGISPEETTDHKKHIFLWKGMGCPEQYDLVDDSSLGDYT